SCTGGGNSDSGFDRLCALAVGTQPMSQEALAVLQAGLNLGVNLISGVALGGIAVNWLKQSWDKKQKQLEYNTSIARSFARAYGEFFGTWELWNDYVDETKPEQLAAATRWELLKRACDAEATVESLLMNITFTRRLTEDQTVVLGKFRQGFQRI